jgi:hypothetical protein
MAGFIRRYGANPGDAEIRAIEGVIILDLPPPGSINGASSGTVGMVGEFADMSYGTAVSSTGVVSTSAQPVEIFSGQDMLDKVGGWDSTLGDFGSTDGNGFFALRNKKFTRLIVCPVNLASAGAGRAWRDLPTNLSATQAVPVVPLAGGRVEGGREFRSGVNRVRLGKRVAFTAVGHFKNAIDGSVTSAGAAATQTFNSAGGGFLTAYNGGPVPKGSLLVVGVISGAGALGANAFTLRVTADAVSATALVVQKLDGTNFDWTTGAALPYRVHVESDGDSGGFNGISAALADTSGYKLPCRPLDATIALGVSLTPTVVPDAGTATSWDPLSGLTLRSHVSAGFVFAAATQTVNVSTTSSGDSLAAMNALYATALDALRQDLNPQRDVNIVFSARRTSTIRSALKTHVLLASGVGLGRMACSAPGLTTVSTSAATADADPGVGANRTERLIYSWPGARTFVPEASGATIATADGLTTTDGILDSSGDGWMAAVLSNLAPERNPGQSGEPVTTVLAPVVALQRGISVLSQADYRTLKATGVAGLLIDRTEGPVFQSGITTSLTSGQLNINRRRMADYIEDSIAAALAPLAKQPATQSWKDSIVVEVDAFLAGLLSENNPALQRINGYLVDDKSGNTPTSEAQGIYVVIAKVRTTPTGDYIVLQAEVGENVVVSTNV